MRQNRTYRSLFISDVHLGWNKSHCGDLALMLENIDCDNIYLVGDFLDIWKLRRRWFWDQDHDFLMSTLLKKRDSGAKITYLTGNHDEALRNPVYKARRELFEARFSFQFAEKITYNSMQYGPVMLLHGDQFDSAFTRLISQSADHGYNGSLEQIMGMGRPKKVHKKSAFSLSRYFRKLAKGSIDEYTSDKNAYTHFVKKKTKDAAVNGIIMGHSHIPFNSTALGQKEPKPNDVFYGNCGDWIDNHCFLAEDHQGNFELLKAEDTLKKRYFELSKADIKKHQAALHPDTKNIRRWIKRIWPDHKTRKRHKTLNIK
jgi:UDP-2,3-diacylglucosamine pyrophosphatase LpxH